MPVYDCNSQPLNENGWTTVDLCPWTSDSVTRVSRDSDCHCANAMSDCERAVHR
jgi:hypothetical protein